jgi:alpha-amylase/alpha-mannosidase (GH57 family)
MRRVTTLALLVLTAACSPAVPSVSPAPAASATPAEAAPAPRTIEPGKLYLAILWHQHQPVYFKDPATGIYERPWVRVHAAKDYLDMVDMLAAYPAVHATFNLTPSLIRQLDDLAAGAKDLYWVHSEVPAEQLTDEQKQFILDRFFDINPKIVARFPRYAELAQQRGSDALNQWTAQDFRDLQVLFNLAWTDPDWLAQEPLASLVAKERDFEEADKAVVFAEHLRLLQAVIPRHAELQQSGQIEVTMTPYAHPILPLLVDSNLAQVGLPDAELPTRFVYGQDAVAQVELGVQLYQDNFGLAPRGMWPAEGSVAESIVSMVAAAGIEWMASDEEVLAASLPDLPGFTRDSQDTVQQADVLYRPYLVEGGRGGPVAILFRDHLISDKVGFEYSGMAGEAAAADFVARLEAIRARFEQEGAQGPHLVTVLLDGENAWEYYENDGKAFLHELYRLLSESQTIVTVTPSEYLTALAATGEPLRPIAELWPGSWIDGTFSTWIGEEEENQAWEYLRQTREAVQQAANDLEPATLEQLMQLVYFAEGSDWFWWYGADQHSGADENFDRQFRSYLEQIYGLLGAPVPDFVHVPVIPEPPQPADREPADFLAAIADGMASPGEWDSAGYYAIDQSGLSSLYYGFDQATLYLRVDTAAGLSPNTVLGIYYRTPTPGPANAYSRYGPGETLLGFGVKQLLEIGFAGGGPAAHVYNADGAGHWTPVESAAARVDQIAMQDGVLELVVPFAAFAPQARSGDRIYLRLVVSENGADQGVVPAAGPALATVPDLPLPNVFVDLVDPSEDDHGPGTYVYPRDQVFKPGVFDLTGLTIGYDEADYVFRLQFRGPVINEWGSPNGLSIQTIDVYLDIDGPQTGDRLLLPGRNASLGPEYGWDYAIWAEGWTPGIFAPSEAGPVQIDSGFTILTNPGQRRVTIRVPRSLLEGEPLDWRIAVTILSQEGFPSAGVWRVRDVLPAAEQWRIGGGSGSAADTRIMDVLWPAADGSTQEQLLHHLIPPGVDPTSLAPDEFPQVLMISP